ncbi:MAG: TetR/AcrR family transcriptional regulator [Microscillaceae bacterium]|nr:TetR/AcrR family transcriptional regulator [Microscillaceae bacterium]
MKKNTRYKIIEFATQLFNREGFGSISLHELAKQMEMSRGNLTYHFKDKDALLEAIVEEMWQKLETEKRESREFPSFKNLHHTARLYYKIQQEFSFIFLDQHVLNHPVLKSRFREITTQVIEDNKAAIAFAIRVGNLKPEPLPGAYNHIAFITWMLSFYWLSQQVIRGERTGEESEKMIWSLLIPHFTEKGMQAFIDFFGEDYYQGLGEPFEVKLEDLISF